MSNHSVIEHRANYHFAKLEEDYLAVCSTGKTSPHCKALILSILECWTNSKRDKGEGEYVFMTVPQWIKYTYMLYERNMITACMRELMEEGLIERRAIVMYNQKTFEYKLCVEQVQARIKALPEKTAKDTLPNLIAYITYQEKCKEKNRAAREEKKVRDLSPTHSDSDKSQGVRDNSPTVGDKSTEGYVINQRNLESITKLPLTSNQRESDAPTDTQPAPLSDIAIAHPTPLPVSVFADDENAHDEADRAVIAHMLSQQGNPDSVFYMPPAPLDAPTAPQADIAAPQEDNAVTVTTEPLGDNPIATAPASITTKKNKRATSEPKEPKITQAQIDRVFETMNEALRSSAVYGQPDFSLVPSRKATEEVKQLIKAKALPSVLKAVILDMWNEFKNGEFWWRLPGRMTVPAICGQYSSRAPSLMPKVKLVAVEPDVPTAERIVDVSQYVTPLMKKMRATKAAFEARQLALQQRKG